MVILIKSLLELSKQSSLPNIITVTKYKSPNSIRGFFLAKHLIDKERVKRE